MDLETFKNSYSGMKDQLNWGYVIVCGLVAVCFLLSLAAVNKKPVIALVPVTLSQETHLTDSSAGESYLKAWGLFMATTTGNLTPGNVGFIKESIAPLVSPLIYSDVMDAIGAQAEQFKLDRVSQSFEPRSIEYEKTTNKVFVYGFSVMTNAAGDDAREDRTFEYQIAIKNYAPSFIFFDTYDGRPRSEKILNQMQQREIAREKREKQYGR